MFTGIISGTTTVIGHQGSGESLAVTFQKPQDWDDLALGESINTDGVCLTVASQDKSSYQCQLMAETLNRTTFGRLLPTQVNVERALKIGDRLGGHFVQGHVDDMGQVVKIDKANGWDLHIHFLPKHRGLVVYKGSIAINGVSLTVKAVKGNVLSVSLVPYTLNHTTLATLRPGDNVNLEFDLVGKYITANMKGKQYAKS
jgi:riboflavin synthase